MTSHNLYQSLGRNLAWIHVWAINIRITLHSEKKKGYAACGLLVHSSFAKLHRGKEKVILERKVPFSYFSRGLKDTCWHPKILVVQTWRL